MIQVSRNVLWALGGRASGQFLRFVAVAVMARLVGPDDVGLVTLALASTGFFWVFADLGLASATIQRAALSQPELSAGFWLSAGLGTLLTLITVALAPALGWFFGRADLVPIAAVLGVLYLLNGLGIQHRTLLMRKMRFGLLAGVEIVAWIASGIVGITIALTLSGPWALVAQPVVRELVATAAYWVLEPWRPSWRFQPSAAAGLLSFGSRLTGFGLISYLNKNVDQMAIGRFLGAVPLGFYSRGIGLMMLGVNGVVEPLGAVLLPALSRLAPCKRRFQDLYVSGAEAACLLSVPVVTLGLLLAPEAVHVVYGSQWAPAVPLFRLLCVSGLAQPLVLLTVPLLVAAGRADRLLLWSVITAPLVGISFLVAAPLGVHQVAAAHALITLALLIPSLAYAYRAAGISGAAVLGRLAPIYTAAAIAATVTFVAVNSLAAAAIARLAMGTGAFLFLYLLVAYALNVPLVRRGCDQVTLLLKGRGVSASLFTKRDIPAAPVDPLRPGPADTCELELKSWAEPVPSTGRSCAQQ